MEKSFNFKNNIIYNLDVSNRMMINWISRSLKNHDVTIAQAQIIAVLHQHDGISQEEISKYLHVARTAIKLTLQQLLQKEYIIKYPSKSDKRIHYFSLTEKGKQLLPLFDSLITEITSRTLDPLSEEERNIFCKLLEKICSISISEFKNEKPQKQ